MREPAGPVNAGEVPGLAGVAAEPWAYDFYALLRRVEARHPQRPRLGTGLRPSEEPLRLGQAPELSFAPAALSGVAPGNAHRPPRLEVRFFGLFGPNGPLPLHLTAYARERLLNEDDPTFARFADMFHHRLLLLFYRTWAQAQPAVSADRGADDRFARFVDALLGMREPSQQQRDAAPDAAKRYFAGHLANARKSAEGLTAVLSGWLQLPVTVVPFVGMWLALPASERTRIGGAAAQSACLGGGAVLGATVWDRQHNFGLRIGPVPLATLESLLPSGDALPALAALTLFHVGQELAWTIDIELRREEVPACRLGRYGRLGWTTWAGRAPHAHNPRVTLHAPASKQKEGSHG